MEVFVAKNQAIRQNKFLTLKLSKGLTYIRLYFSAGLHVR